MSRWQSLLPRQRWAGSTPVWSFFTSTSDRRTAREAHSPGNDPVEARSAAATHGAPLAFFLRALGHPAPSRRCLAVGLVANMRIAPPLAK